MAAFQAAETPAALAAELGGWEKLRSAPAEDILRLQSRIPGARWAPTLDGTVVVEDAAEALAAGRFTKAMPLMIGHIQDEWTLFTMFNERLASLDRDGLLALAREPFGDRAPEAVACYEAERGDAGLSTAPAALWAAISNDRMFRLPAIRTAECHLAHTPQVWMYRFDRPSSARGGRLGACHSLDIPYVWGTHGLPAMRRFCGEGEAVARLSASVMASWLSFARDGTPAMDGVPWPRYQADGAVTAGRQTLLLDDEPRLAEAPFDATRQLWAA